MPSTLTRPEHLVLPFLQCALMFERSTRYVLLTEFGSSMDYSSEHRIRIWSYLYLFAPHPDSLYDRFITMLDRVLVQIKEQSCTTKHQTGEMDKLFHLLLEKKTYSNLIIIFE